MEDIEEQEQSKEIMKLSRGRGGIYGGRKEIGNKI